MEITFPLYVVKNAAIQAAEQIELDLAKSKQKLIEAYGKPYRVWFAPWRKITPTPEQAWEIARKNGMYDIAFWKRDDMRQNLARCKKLQELASVLHSVDGNMTLSDNGINLLREFL